MSELDQIKSLLPALSQDQINELDQLVRQAKGPHPLEQRLNLDADSILDALNRAGELTYRNIRGVIAEAAFGRYILPKLNGFTIQDISEEESDRADYVVRDDGGSVGIQVKLQRSEKQEPLVYKKDNSYIRHYRK